MPGSIPFKEALKFWVKLGFINFGGPAGQIAIMQHELVESRRWVSQNQFLRALNFCMILPGPEAQQLAIYTGWLMHGARGGVAAGVFFVLPSVFVLLGLSWLAASSADVPAIQGLLYGVQPAVIAIVASALLQIGRRTLCHPGLVAYAAAAFVAIRFLSIPFPYVIGAAALSGLILQRFAPRAYKSCELMHPLEPPNVNSGRSASAGEAGAKSTGAVDSFRYTLRRSLFLVALFFALWGSPVLVLMLWPGAPEVLAQEALFFTKAAFVTFGGAYAVLSYIADMAVNYFGWLDARQMAQGLGLAESTPGPLIMVTQFVGFMGAYKFSGGLDPLVSGMLGALITTYMTFLPCFFFIFLGAPHIERLSENLTLQAALVAVTSSVVGVILNLAVFFSEKVLLPAPGIFDYFALAMAVVCFAVSQRYRIPMHYLAPFGAVAGMAWHLIR